MQLWFATYYGTLLIILRPIYSSVFHLTYNLLCFNCVLIECIYNYFQIFCNYHNFKVMVYKSIERYWMIIPPKMSNIWYHLLKYYPKDISFYIRTKNSLCICLVNTNSDSDDQDVKDAAHPKRPATINFHYTYFHDTSSTHILPRYNQR